MRKITGWLMMLVLLLASAGPTLAEQNTAIGESACLAQFPDKFQRKQNVLTLYPVAPNSSSKRLEDTDLSAGGVEYRISDHLPELALTLIREQGYEHSDAWLFHHASGSWLPAFGHWRLSPDRRYLLTFNGDESGFAANALAIYRLDNPPVQVSAFYPQDFMPLDAHFDGAQRIVIKTLYQTDGEIQQRERCVLRLYGSLWQLEDALCYQRMDK